MTTANFYRLRSAGVLSGDSPVDAKPRCELYARYLKNKYRDDQIVKARKALINLLKGNCSAPYEEIESKLLELPFVWEKDLQGMLKELWDVPQSITVQGWKPKQRKFQKGHVFIRKGN